MNVVEDSRTRSSEAGRRSVAPDVRVKGRAAGGLGRGIISRGEASLNVPICWGCVRETLAA